MPPLEPTSAISKKLTRPEPSFEAYYASMTAEERDDYNAEPSAQDVEAWRLRDRHVLALVDFEGYVEKAVVVEKRKESCDHMNAVKAAAQADYDKDWTNALLKCIKGKGAHSFSIDLRRNQKETAKDLRNAALWPDGWSRDNKSKYLRPPSVRMIERKIPALEKEIEQALYKHKPSSTHKRCDFCPRPS